MTLKRSLRLSCNLLLATLASAAILEAWGLPTANAQPLAELPDPVLPDNVVPAPVPASAPASPAPTVAPAPAPAAPAQDLVNAQVGVRGLLRVQNPNARDQLDDAGAEGEANAILFGQAHPFLKWQAGFAGFFGAQATTSAVLLDLVAKLEFAQAFNLWFGRMPIPSDRASLSTVWAIAPWTLPGQYGTTVTTLLHPAPGPRQGINDRGDGATLWGQWGGGVFKYYLGVFGLGDPGQSPLYSARLNLNLLSPEPGFRATSSYFGGKDILSIGVGFQHQSGGSLAATGLASAASDFNELNTDVLLEIGGPTTGVLDLEGAFAKLWGNNELADYQFFALISYLVPLDVGFGRFQPLVRVQHAGQGPAADAIELTSLEAQLGYIVDGHHARLLGLYQYSKLGEQTQNAILLGVQLLSRGK